MADVKYEIVKRVAVIGDKGGGWIREINLVRWNDGGPKVDIRDWNKEFKTMRKGITLNRQEFLTLVKSLRKIDAQDVSDSFGRYEHETGGEAEADYADTPALAANE